MLCLGHLCKKHRVRKVAVASVMHLIDFIHDTRYLCTRIKTDGILAMSLAISEVIKFASMSNRGRVCLFIQNQTTI